MAATSGRTRRQFVRDAGGLLVGFSLFDPSIAPRLFAAPAPAGVEDAPAPGRLDSWLRVGKDGRVQVFTGKVEIGMGVETAFAQFVADELDVPVGRVSFVMGDTARTADQGGVGGSTSVSLGSTPLRNAAATARVLLLDAASRRLGVPADRLAVRDGVVSVNGRAARRVSYAALVAAHDLDGTLNVSGAGFAVSVEGVGKPKDPSDTR